MRLHRLDDHLVTPLSEMLRGIEPTFRPFEFSPEGIRMAVKEEDEHWVVTTLQSRVVTYGMLRGWAEGHALPALGIAVDTFYRRRGLATAMILHLHRVAAERGARQVMLHVDETHVGAQSLYRAFGYRPREDRWVCDL